MVSVLRVCQSVCSRGSEGEGRSNAHDALDLTIQESPSSPGPPPGHGTPLHKDPPLVPTPASTPSPRQGTSLYRKPSPNSVLTLLVTSGGQHYRPVQTGSLEDPAYQC